MNHVIRNNFFGNPAQVSLETLEALAAYGPEQYVAVEAIQESFQLMSQVMVYTLELARDGFSKYGRICGYSSRQNQGPLCILQFF